MSNPILPDSAIAVNDSKARVILALGQLLEQCEDDDVPALINQVKTKLARRYYALNASQCRLLDIPPELLVTIGELLLGKRASHQSRSKLWFTRSIFPLLQTCSQLRTQLQPLRSTPLDCFIRSDHPWSDVMRAKTDWRGKGLHKLPTTIVVTTISMQYKPSTAAALAAALECAIYGSLENTGGLHPTENDSW